MLVNKAGLVLGYVERDVENQYNSECLFNKNIFSQQGRSPSLFS